MGIARNATGTTRPRTLKIISMVFRIRFKSTIKAAVKYPALPEGFPDFRLSYRIWFTGSACSPGEILLFPIGGYIQPVPPATAQSLEKGSGIGVTVGEGLHVIDRRLLICLFGVE